MLKILSVTREDLQIPEKDKRIREITFDDLNLEARQAGRWESDLTVLRDGPLFVILRNNVVPESLTWGPIETFFLCLPQL